MYLQRLKYIQKNKTNIIFQNLKMSANQNVAQATIDTKGTSKPHPVELKGDTGITDRYEQHKSLLEAQAANAAATQDFYNRQQIFANLRRAKIYALFDDTSSGSSIPQGDIFRDAKIRPSRFLTDRERASVDSERAKLVKTQISKSAKVYA